MSDTPRGSAARCPFCEAQPGQAVTATEAQAETHREHKRRGPFSDTPCPVYDDGGHRNTEALVPASYFKCKCGFSYQGAARFA